MKAISNTAEHSPRYGLISLYTALVLLATNGLFSKTIPLPALEITQLRTSIAAIAFILFFVSIYIVKRRHPWQLDSLRDYAINYGLGLVMGIHWATFFYSMQISSVAIGMLSLACYPIITVCLEPLINGQRPLARDLFAALIVLVGFGVMVPEWNLSHDHSAGLAWGFVSALTMALRNIFQRRFLRNYPAPTVMLHQVVAIALGFALLADFSLTNTLSREDWLLLVLLGAVTTAFAHSLISVSLRHFSAKTVGLISCIQPLIGAFLAWLFINELPELRTFIGGSIILAAAVWETRQAQKS